MLGGGQRCLHNKRSLWAALTAWPWLPLPMAIEEHDWGDQVLWDCIGEGFAKKRVRKHKILISYICPVMKFISELRKRMFVEKQALVAFHGTWCCREIWSSCLRSRKRQPEKAPCWNLPKVLRAGAADREIWWTRHCAAKYISRPRADNEGCLSTPAKQRDTIR